MEKRKNLYMSMVFIIAMGLLFTQCNKTEDLNNQNLQQPERTAVQIDGNPAPGQFDIPSATVKLQTYESIINTKKSVEDPDCESSLIPAYLEATLAAGESVGETKVGSICGAPPKGDVIALFDLTGSMGQELNNAKANSLNIMNAIDAIIGDAQFGVMSHMDYVGSFSGCGYGATYGGGPDYPYSLDQPLTSNFTDVSNGINGLSLGYGYDFAENYTRPFFESYSDANVGWRTGSKKVVVAMLDAIPHDCTFDDIIAGTGTSGPDPGRDGVVGGGDDLEILTVLQEMKDNNITLIVLYSGSGYFDLWEAYTAITGGVAFQLNSDGTLPGGSGTVSTLIADLINDDVIHVDEVALEVCTDGFEDWLVSVDPEFYADIDLSEPWTGDFEINVTVPEGTEDGVYEFDICLMADGVEYGRQHVIITVINTIDVPFDIHPTSCPNPINRKSGGVMPAAILGTDSFDVSQIDPATLNINGVFAVKWSLEDVAEPYSPFIDKDLDKMSCNTYGPDGFVDLTLKFNSRDIAGLLAAYERDDVVKLEITGELYDGTQIRGEDIIIIVK